MAGSQEQTLGKVFLVGAGPGDPGMLTIRGKQCLELADIVLHDYLANPTLLKWATQAEQICLGKHGSGRLYSQEEVNRQIVKFAKAGKQVVRLKGGDPAIFARTHEELSEICRHKIPFEVVPGITAALAVTSTVGIPLTHRDFASAVALITGQGKAGGPATPIDYRALAHFPGTLVFYMGTTTVESWSSELIVAGLDPATTVVAVRNCSLPTQSTFQCRLDEISSRVNQEKRLRPPVLFVVGKTAGEFGKFNWFEKRPLFGQSVLVTRPAHQAESLSSQLAELGADVLLQPAIEVGSVADNSEVLQTVRSITDFDWIVFSSVNGVEYLMQALFQNEDDIRRLSGIHLAAIGPATAARLESYHLKPALVPESFEADQLARQLIPKVENQNVLLVRASRGREVLFEQLSRSAAAVKQVVFYQSTDVQQASSAVAEKMERGEIDFTTVTSSAIAKSLANLFGKALHQTRLISISPVTTATLQELGFSPAIEAETYTIPGLIECLLNSISDAG